MHRDPESRAAAARTRKRRDGVRRAASAAQPATQPQPEAANAGKRLGECEPARLLVRAWSTQLLLSAGRSDPFTVMTRVPFVCRAMTMAQPACLAEPKVLGSGCSQLEASATALHICSQAYSRGSAGV